MVVQARYNNPRLGTRREAGDGGPETEERNSLAWDLERVVVGLRLAQERIIVTMAAIHDQWPVEAGSTGEGRYSV